MDNMDVPEYFVCPISLQIMTDPVTAASGITYDRDSIERWLFGHGAAVATCPVTKQLLPRDSDLTPNHTLRRLIQAWCLDNGLDRIPSPKAPVTKLYVMNLMEGLTRPDSHVEELRKLEALAAESERKRVFLVDAGLAKALVDFIVLACRRSDWNGLEEALALFYLVRAAIGQSRADFNGNGEIIDSLNRVLKGNGFVNAMVKTHAAYVLKVVIQKASSSILEMLNPEFFNIVLSQIREFSNVSHKGMNSLLHILLDVCPWGRNRVLLVESGAVSDLIKVERTHGVEKKTIELVLGILCHLCSCADGRAQLIDHAAGIAMVTRRILRVSSSADDRAVFIIWLICKYSGTDAVLREMMRVGTVSKLCMVMQADCASIVKERAKEILKSHSDVWKGIEHGDLIRYMG